MSSIIMICGNNLYVFDQITSQLKEFCKFPTGIVYYDHCDISATNLQVAENGLIVLTNTPINQQWNETFPQPMPLDGPVLDGTDPEIVGLLASFWADSSTESTFHKVSES